MVSPSLDALVDEPGGWDATRWWRLELRAWQRSPDLVLALAVLAPRDAWSRERPRVEPGGCLRGLAVVLSLVAPTLGGVLVLGWAQGEGERLLPMAGALFLVALAVTVSGELRDRRSPRAADPGGVLSVAACHLLPGIAALAIAGIAVAVGAVPASTELVLLVPIALDVVAHVALLRRGPGRPGGPRNRIENLERSVAEVPPAQREAVVRELARAIERLRSSGRIDDALAERARRCPPGMLARTVAGEAGSASGERARPR